jgi:ubiquinone biosynthesis protein
MLSYGNFVVPNWLLDVQRSLRFTSRAIIRGTWPLLRYLAGRRDNRWGVSLRQMLEDMGSTYLKLGQYLAIRFDLLPAEVCRELEKLFERVPPVPFDLIRPHVEAELGGKLEDLFATFNPECLAAASIAQVHRATAKDGRLLAVKVQRPGIDRIIAADLRNLRRMAWVADFARLLRSISLVDAVTEFMEYTLREIDFVVEGTTADALHATMSDVVTPEIVWPLSSSRILTMGFIEGISLARVIGIVREDPVEGARLLKELDLREAVRILAVATLRQLFVNGFFHADPHPGNILLGPNHLVALVDFGIFGRLDADQRKALKGYVENLLVGNVDQSYREYEKLITFSLLSDRAAFRVEVKDTMRKWLAQVLDPNADPHDRHVGTIADRKASLLYKYHVKLDVNTLLFWRTLIVLDGTALRLFPDFDLAGTLGEFFKSLQPSTGDRIYASISAPQSQSANRQLILGFAGKVNEIRSVSAENKNAASVRVQYQESRSEPAGNAMKCLCTFILTCSLYHLAGTPRARWELGLAGTIVTLYYARTWKTWAFYK